MLLKIWWSGWLVTKYVPRRKLNLWGPASANVLRPRLYFPFEPNSSKRGGKKLAQEEEFCTMGDRTQRNARPQCCFSSRSCKIHSRLYYPVRKLRTFRAMSHIKSLFPGNLSLSSPWIRMYHRWCSRCDLKRNTSKTWQADFSSHGNSQSTNLGTSPLLL